MRTSPVAIYENEQRGPLCLLLIACASALSLIALFSDLDESTRLFLALAAIAMSVIGLSFYSLKTLVTREELLIRFGPLPIFKKSVALSDIQDVTIGRSLLIDGFGIHYRPGEGWIWNLWGFDCVKLMLKNEKRFRIGSNDVNRLFDALKTAREKLENSKS